MKIAIIGSRKFKSLKMVSDYVKTLPRGTIVISGGARGVDSVAANMARFEGFQVIEIIPNWNDGHQAGYARNTLIAEECDRMVAFWDGESKGTKDSIEKCQALGKEVQVIVA